MSYATPTRFVADDVDPRLDSYFLTRVWRGQEEALRYAVGGGEDAGGGLADSASGQLFSTF